MNISSHVLMGSSNLSQVIGIDKNGNIREIKEGITPKKGEVIIALNDQEDNLNNDQDEILNSDALPNPISSVNIADENNVLQNIDPKINELLQALESGVDPTTLGEEFDTAAGEEGGSSLGPSATITRTASETIASTEFSTKGLEITELSSPQISTLSDFTSSLTTVTTLTDENTPPTGESLNITINEDTQISGILNISDVDSDSLILSIITSPDNGSFTLQENGEWSYTPNTNFDGNNFVVISVNDQNGGEIELRIDLTVTPIPELSFSGQEIVNEGDTSSYLIELDKPSTQDTSFKIDLNLNAAESADIETLKAFINEEEISISTDGIIVIPQGETSVTLIIQTTQDNVFEGDEDFELNIKPVFGLINSGSITTTIKDDGSLEDGDDDRPTVSISGNTNINEGEYADYNISLDKSSDEILEVKVDLSNITTENNDIEAFEYKDENEDWVSVPNDGTLEFSPNVTNLEIRIKSSQNDVFEGSENFKISVEGQKNVLGSDEITTNILDDGSLEDGDDDRPTVSISGDDYIEEGEYAFFEVNLDKQSELESKIKISILLNDIELSDINDIEIKIGNAQWVALSPDGIVEIDGGISSFNLRVLATDDSLYEQSESFEIKAEAIENALGVSTAEATILANDNTAPIATDFNLNVVGGKETINFDENISDLEDDLNSEKAIKISITELPEYGSLYYTTQEGERIELKEYDSFYEGETIEYVINPNLIDLNELMNENSFYSENIKKNLNGTASLELNGITLSGGLYDEENMTFYEYGTLIYDHAAGEKGLAINTSNNNGLGNENGIGEYIKVSFNDIQTSSINIMLGSIGGLFNNDKAAIKAYLYKDGILIETINELSIIDREDGHNKEADALIQSEESFDEVILVVENKVNGLGAGYVLQGIEIMNITNTSYINDTLSYIVEDTDGLLGNEATVQLGSEGFYNLSQDSINHLELDNNELILTKINDTETTSLIIGDYNNDIIIKGGDKKDYIITGDKDDTIYLGDSENNINCNDEICDIFEDQNADIVYSKGGNDLIYGENGIDVIYAGDDNDAVYGGSGNDIIYGENGNDLLIGGTGNDYMIGGDGYDIFKILEDSLSIPEQDIIKDFTSGEDKIDLSSLIEEEDDSLEELFTLIVINNTDIELSVNNTDYSILLTDAKSQYVSEFNGEIMNSSNILDDLLIQEII